MLSDEEKQAIEGLKGSQKWIRQQIRLGNLPNYNQGHYADIQIVLNLIERQSKEIEEYKKQLDLDYVDKHFVPVERYNQLEKEIEELKAISEYRELKAIREYKEKIIKEIEKLNKSDASKEQSSMHYYNLYKELVDKIKAKIEEVEQWELYNMKIPRLSTLDERLGAKIGIKYVLQSLLEKE